ncbi:MAG: PGF-pre-PGF domain-containing protein [Haloplanus sp.]
MTRQSHAVLLVAALVVLGSLGSPLVGTAVAASDQAAIYDSVNGAQISTATDGQTVYINANDTATTNGSTVDVTVTNDSGGSITVTLYDNGTNADSSDGGSNGEYWGSFTVSATTTDDASDTLQVAKRHSANVTVDLDGQNDGATASVTADYGPVPTAATTHDNTTDGTVDNVTVTFDEPVDSASVSTSDFSVDGSSPTGVTDTDGDDTLVLQVGSTPTNDTGITPGVTVLQDALQDSSGNAGPATGDVTVTATDGAAPVALSATYLDANADGAVDRIDVGYSEDVSASTYTDGNWSLTAGSVGLSKNGTAAISGAEIQIDVAGTADTTGGSTAPTLDYAGTSVTDGSNAAPAQTLTVADGAAPTFAGATTADLVANGHVDNLTVTFTEAVASGSVEAADLSVNGLSGTVVGVASDDGDDTVNVTLSEGSTADTGATPTLAYTQAGGSSSAIQDGAGNLMADATSDPAADGAAPYALSITAFDGGDGSTDGTVDQLRVRYSEDVSASTPELGDYSLGGTDAGNVTLDSVGTNGNDIELGVTGPANDTALDLTLSYDRTAGASDSVVDGVTNPASSFTGRTVADGAGPLLQSVTTADMDNNGTVETLHATYTEPVDGATATAGDFSLSTGSADSLALSLSGDTARLSVSGFPTDTSVTPDVTLSGDSIQDLAATPNGNPSQTLTATDSAPPAVTAAATKDANGDGAVDRIDLTLSEPIDDGASTLSASAFSLSSGSVDGATTGATADDDAVRLSVSGFSGSDATPDVTYASDTFVDSLGNGISGSTTFTGTTSGAAPVVQSATTLDRDGDGDIDAATLTFSGSVDDSTVAPGDWALGGTTVEAVDTLSTADDDTLQLRITTDANEVPGTAAVEVTYTPGSAADPQGNSIAAVADTDVSEADGATPVVTNVSASTDVGSPATIEVTVTASESLGSVSVDLSGPQSRTLSSFAVSGDGPYTHTLTYTVDTAGTYTATLQRAADAAGNDGAASQQDTVAAELLQSSGGGSGPRAPGSPTDRVDSATIPVFSGTQSATFDLGSGAVDRVDINSEGEANGFARATALSSLPDDTPAPADRTVSIVSLQMPDGWRSSPATVRMTVDASAVDADPERLRIARYDDEAGSWSTLETTVERRSGDTVVLTAETPGFSTFAVTETDEAVSTGTTPPTATPTAAPPADGGSDTVTVSVTDDTATPPSPTTDTATPAAPTTAGEGAGFGPLVSLAGLFALFQLLRRRG